MTSTKGTTTATIKARNRLNDHWNELYADIYVYFIYPYRQLGYKLATPLRSGFTLFTLFLCFPGGQSTPPQYGRAHLNGAADHAAWKRSETVEDTQVVHQRIDIHVELDRTDIGLELGFRADIDVPDRQVDTPLFTQRNVDTGLGREAPGVAELEACFLSAQDITAGYTAVDILHRVNLRLQSGEIVSIIGPNGAGKSTLLKTIFGILVPRQGKVVLKDQDITGLRPDKVARQGISYVPQVSNVFPSLTILVVLYALGGSWLLHETIKWPLPARLGISFAILGLLGLLMGMPFPTGIRWAGTQQGGIVPWLWGINGSLSVLGAVLSVTIAVHAGFRITLLIAAAIYGIAGAAMIQEVLQAGRGRPGSTDAQ